MSVNNPHKCSLCQNESELHKVDNPSIRVCGACRLKMQTMIPIVCTGCDTCYWLPKTPRNVMWAANYFGIDLQTIMEEPVLGSIVTCKYCIAVRDVGVDEVCLH